MNQVKRTWTPILSLTTNQISNENEITIDIWDSGSYIYERWPDGDVCWKVISRELAADANGFTEIIQKMPEWFSPGQVLHWARVPLNFGGPSQYQFGQWNVVVDQEYLQQRVQAQPLLQAQPLVKMNNMTYREGKSQGTQRHRGVGVKGPVKSQVSQVSQVSQHHHQPKPSQQQANAQK